MAGIRLPLRIPVSGPKALSGTCYIYNDLFFNFPLLTDSQGGANIGGTFSVSETAHNGLVVHAQALGFDSKANSFGLVSSNAFQMQIVAPYEGITVGHVQVIGATGTVGVARSDQGLVMQPTELARGRTRDGACPAIRESKALLQWAGRGREGSA